MTSSRKNKTIYIDKEAASALELVDESLLAPVTKLMNEKESQRGTKNRAYRWTIIPFSFVLAPSEKKRKNHSVFTT